MSNPRYIPRSFAVRRKDFGREREIEWRVPDEGWTMLQRAQMDASELQHRISLEVQNTYMPAVGMTELGDLASAIGMAHEKLQRIFAGRGVMQLEDIGRLRRRVGRGFDAWLVRDGSSGRPPVQLDHDLISRLHKPAPTAARPPMH